MVSLRAFNLEVTMASSLGIHWDYHLVEQKVKKMVFCLLLKMEQLKEVQIMSNLMV